MANILSANNKVLKSGSSVFTANLPTANIQPSKSVTVTSNGTTTITPDAPYDAMGQVGVTVNVAGAELVSFTIQIKSPIVPGWKIYLTNNTGIQIVESKGTYTVYKNSFILTDGIEAEMSVSSGIQRIIRNTGGSLGYFITGDAIFYV